MDIAHTPIAQFAASVAGRVTRIVAGIVLVLWGFTLLASPLGLALAVIGLVPLTAGIFDVCVVSVLLGGPFRGDAIRAAGAHHRMIAK